MNPSIAQNQQRLFLAFVAELRPHIGRDSALPRRIKELFARHRAIGSRDRKLYRELVYTYLRFLPWIDPLLGSESECRAAASRQATTAGTATSAGPTNAELAAKITAWLAHLAKQRTRPRSTKGAISILMV